MQFSSLSQCLQLVVLRIYLFDLHFSRNFILDLCYLLNMCYLTFQSLDFITHFKFTAARIFRLNLYHTISVHILHASAMHRFRITNIHLHIFTTHSDRKASKRLTRQTTRKHELVSISKFFFFLF